MDDTRELKQAYDIFTVAWRIYKTHYPPKNLKDDSYWSELMEVIEKTETEYNCQLCKDVFSAVASDLERKVKVPQVLKR